MAINFFSERIVTLKQASRQLPKLRDGRPLHVSTIARWASRGVKGVRLETARQGGQRVTSIEALERFRAEVSARAPLGGQHLALQSSADAGRQEATRRADGDDDRRQREVEEELKRRFKL